MFLCERLGHASSPKDSSLAGVRFLFVSLVAATLLFLTAFTGSSQAGVNSYCYSNGNPISIGPNGNCVSNYYSTLNQVLAITHNGNGVNHCATAKDYANGSGGDVFTAVCGTGQIQATACYTPEGAYAKIVSKSPNTHLFRGRAYYSWQCF